MGFAREKNVRPPPLIREIIPPTFRGVVKTNGEADIRTPSRFFGREPQLETGVFEQLAAFSTVTGNTARDDIFPVRRATERARDDMIVCQLAGRQTTAAVLALVFVARVYILP